MDNATSLLDFCPPEYREQVLAGEIELLPGQKEDKPVIRWADGPKKGQILPGSGRFPKANDIAAVSKATAHKRTASYQEAMNLLMNVDAGPEVRGSFAWWYNQAMEAAEGSPQRVVVGCYHDDCDEKAHERTITATRKDGTLIFKLLELKHGKAKETKEIDVNQKTMIDLMETRQVVVHVYGMDDNTLKEREDFISGLLEGEYRELPASEGTSD